MRKKQTVIYALLSAALFGLSAPCAKLLLGGIAPLMLAALLYLGCGLGLLLLLLFQTVTGLRFSRESRPGTSDIGWLAGAILAGGVAAPIVLMVSLVHTSAATTSLLLNFESIATVMLAAVLFHEAVGKRVWLSIGLVAGASVLLSLDLGSAWGFSIGALGVLFACALWGLDNNLTQRISAKDPLISAMIKGIVAGSVSLLLALASGSPIPGMVRIISAMALGFVSYGLSIYLFILSLRAIGTARTGVLFGTAPFLAVVVSFSLFGLAVNWQFLTALPLMIAGAYLLLTERHEHLHHHEEFEHDHRHVHDEHHRHGHKDRVASDHEHTHRHQHLALTHVHPHLPDIHHRHEH